jgi:flagellar hook assembly protein FlgD
LPNPFDRSTLIRYELARKAEVTIEIFDVAGQVVNTLVDLPSQDAGPHSVHWDGRDGQGREVAPGVYFYRMKTGEFEKTRRVTYIR